VLFVGFDCAAASSAGAGVVGAAGHIQPAIMSSASRAPPTQVKYRTMSTRVPPLRRHHSETNHRRTVSFQTRRPTPNHLSPKCERIDVL
jgi:hypothetical protein